MDTLTHLVAGALTPLAFPRAPKRAALLGFGIAAGELPDIDIFFGSTPDALMTLHRGITHALVAQPLLALLVVLPCYVWIRRSTAALSPHGGALSPDAFRAAGPCASGESPAGRGGTEGQPRLVPGQTGLGSLFLMALFALYTHVYLDCMTTFGTQIFLPFSPARVGLPAMFIVDLLLTLPALALMFYAWRQPPSFLPLPAESPAGVRPGSRQTIAYGAFASPKARRIARIGLAWMLLYPLASLGVNAMTTAAYAPVLAPEGALRLLTEPFSPFVWKVVVEERGTYRMGTLFLGSSRPPEFATFVQPEPLLYETLKRQHPLFGQFEAFAPLMVQMERPATYLTQTEYDEQVTEYSFVDLRYLMSKDSPARFFGRNDPNFILEARINDSGALLAWRFLRRGALTTTPWTLLQ